MRKVHNFILLTLAGLVISSFMSPAQTSESKLPEGEGRATTERVCSACHGIHIVVNERHTRAEWQKLVDDMVARGADATNAEVKTIVDYLTKYFCPKE